MKDDLQLYIGLALNERVNNIYKTTSMRVMVFMTSGPVQSVSVHVRLASWAEHTSIYKNNHYNLISSNLLRTQSILLSKATGLVQKHTKALVEG